VNGPQGCGGVGVDTIGTSFDPEELFSMVVCGGKRASTVPKNVE
jgi:hypothetical protein